MSVANFSAEDKAIRKLDAEWGDAATAGKLEEVVAFYAPTGSVVWPGAPAAHGTANIRKAWEGIFGEYKGLSLKFTAKRIDFSERSEEHTSELQSLRHLVC